MGKPVKMSDRNKEWFLRNQSCHERTINNREERQRFLIVCEGEKTEPNYFEAFKKELPRNIIHLVIYGEGANTLSLVSRAMEIQSEYAMSDYPYDQVWVVFDRDSFSPDNFDNSIAKAESHGIRCAWSNEAFELWYILHFVNRSTGMNRTEYQEKLTRFLLEPYRKNDNEMYGKLHEKGSESDAIQRAKNLHENAPWPRSYANPCTTVYKLVEELNKFTSVPTLVYKFQ